MSSDEDDRGATKRAPEDRDQGKSRERSRDRSGDRDDRDGARDDRDGDHGRERDKSGDRNRDDRGRNDSASGSNTSKSLFIRHLNYDTSPQDLRKEFEEFGDIRDVYIPLDFKSGLPKGFGFVEFADAEDAKYAQKKMDGATLQKYTISVVIAEDRRKSPGAMRKEQQKSGKGGGKGKSRDRSRGRGGDYNPRWTERYSKRSRSRGHKRSPPRRKDSRDRGRDRSPPREKKSWRDAPDVRDRKGGRDDRDGRGGGRSRRDDSRGGGRGRGDSRRR